MMPSQAQYVHPHQYAMLNQAERIDQEPPAGIIHSNFFGQLIANQGTDVEARQNESS